MSTALPQHVAVVMDGNGRWASQQGLSRSKGHEAGYHALKNLVTHAVEINLNTLSVFAFSTENWARPSDEVNTLMALFLYGLESELDLLNQQNVRLSFVGDLSGFLPEIQEKAAQVQAATEKNNGLRFVIAMNYGGRWDILQACKVLASDVQQGKKTLEEITDESFNAVLQTADLPEPDLFIRTSGEQRVSNFFLWQLAYTEFYFSEKLWPDFSPQDFDQAVLAFQKRQRRFGRTPEQEIKNA